MGDKEFREFLERNDKNGTVNISDYIVQLALKEKSVFVLSSCEFLMKCWEKKTELGEDVKSKVKEVLMNMLDQIPQTVFQYDVSVMDMDDSDEEADDTEVTPNNE